MQGTWFFVFVFAVGALIFAFALFSRPIKAFVSPALPILMVGAGLGAAFPRPRDELLGTLEILSWIAVGFGVVGIALRFELADLRRLWRPAAAITLAAMAGMWAIASASLWGLFGLPLLTALLLGAVVTPTDPVVASSIVTGPFAERRIPARLRNLLSLESGTNDGLAFAFVFLPLLLIEHGAAGWGEWLGKTVLWEIGVAAVTGLAAGIAGGMLARCAFARGGAPGATLLLLALAFTVAALGLMKAFRTDSIWAAFVAALALAALLPEARREVANELQEGLVYATMVPALLVFGMALPWRAWAEMPPAAVAGAAAVPVLRRLPVILALDRLGGVAAFRHRRDAWFYGWFGPVGLSAVYYATIAARRLGADEIWPVASLLVAASIVVHGATAAAATRWYAGARHAGDARDGGDAKTETM